MKNSLIVVDVQNEFVTDPRLTPDSDTFLSGVEATLDVFRKQNAPIVHVHFITEPDGRGHMSHHKTEGRIRCARGTTCAEAHPIAKAKDGELTFAKHAYSAFSSAELEAKLLKTETDTVVICGLYSHVCVRQTALDALDRNFRVIIVKDAIATYDALHGQVTENFLTKRGVEYLHSSEISNYAIDPDENHEVAALSEKTVPVASIDYQWIQPSGETLFEQRNPSNWDEILSCVPSAKGETVQSAVSSAVSAQNKWKTQPLQKRLDIVLKWARTIEVNAEKFLPLMVKEVGKPLSASQVELGLLRHSIVALKETISNEALERICKKDTDQLAIARRRPQGVVAIIAPWNNPVFLPASKIAAAIALGNGVVWKPALPCVQTSILLQNSLQDAGVPSGLVNMVFGGAETAEYLIQLPEINAVTLTGSVETGRQVAATCGSLLKPLQAELGGNNAAIITEHCNLNDVADKIALSAFGYAGQACTATRRLILFESIAEEFFEHLKASVESVKIGLPDNNDTVIGPVISKSKQQAINQLVKDSEPNCKIFEVPLPDALVKRGCWLPPRIIQGLDNASRLVQEESFAPILILQTATDLEDAIRLCNGVPNGLIASIFCENVSIIQTFQEEIDAGILQLNLPSRNLHMESPFGGWKDSGLGPPEHGIWDLDFYTQWQAVNKKLL